MRELESETGYVRNSSDVSVDGSEESEVEMRLRGLKTKRRGLISKCNDEKKLSGCDFDNFHPNLLKNL